MDTSADPRSEQLDRAVSLTELRRARDLTQTQVARALGATQPGVSAIEHRTDIHLSTLRSYVEALGGRLEITAVFADAMIPVSIHEVDRHIVDNGIARLIWRNLRERHDAGDEAAGRLAEKFDALAAGRVTALHVDSGSEAMVLYETVQTMDPPSGTMSAAFARIRAALEAELGVAGF